MQIHLHEVIILQIHLHEVQIHLHEVQILQIHNVRPEFVKKKISRLLTNQNPAFLYKV